MWRIEKIKLTTILGHTYESELLSSPPDMLLHLEVTEEKNSRTCTCTAAKASFASKLKRKDIWKNVSSDFLNMKSME